MPPENQVIISEQIMEGTRVGSFEIGKRLFDTGRQIGRGTFCEVRQGVHLLTRELVAVKIFSKSQPERMRQSIKEWKILRELKHPNIVQAYQLLETGSVMYLVMQHVPNGELFDYVRACGKIDEKNAAKFFSQLLSVVAYLQQNKIAHRDIKPENILLTADYNIKLADFGLSCSYQEDVMLKECCGSPCYALPEMLIGRSYDPVAADMWSVGMVLYAMVCGYLPFDERSPKRLYEQTMHQPLPLPLLLSQELCELLRGLLNKNFATRLKITEARNHKWLVNSLKKPDWQDANTPGLRVNILEQMNVYGVDKSYTLNSFKKNEYNFSTTLYYMLEKKELRETSEWKAIEEKYLRRQRRIKGNSQQTISSDNHNLQKKFDIDSLEQSVRVNDSTAEQSKSKRRKTSLRRSDAMTIKLGMTTSKQPWSVSLSILKKNRAGSSCRRMREKERIVSNQGVTTPTPKSTINEDYFKDQSRVRKVSRKKKMSLHDQAAADFVSSHEYQSMLVAQKRSKKRLKG